MIRTLLFLLVAGILIGTTFWIYLRAELRVAGRRAFALLRSGALVLLLAAAFDVHLPWGGAAASRPRWVLLDASLSMSAGDGSAWRDAHARARTLEGQGWTVVRFGDGVVPGDSIASPEAVRTALAPALKRATEAGADEVKVLSDLRFQDPVEVESGLAVAETTADFEAFGANGVNAGVAGFDVSDQLDAGDPVDAWVEIFGEGIADSLSIEVREEGRLVLAEKTAPPAPGLRTRVPLELPAPQGEGRLRYTVRVGVPGDAFPSDDEGVAYMSAGHEEGGLVVVTLVPDWEARALLEVLGEATGLSATGYMRVGPDRFAPMGRAFQRGAPVDSVRVRRAVTTAALVVVHGLNAGTDAWGRSLVDSNAREILWPLDARGADAVGVATGPLRAGEWYASPGAQASPLAADLAGAPLRDLPPLTALLPLTTQPAAPPLLVQLGGTGSGEPALVLDRSGGHRRAIVLAQGFWRWGARDGAGRDAYRRLWSGVGGWLLAQDPTTVASEVRPERWVVPRGAPVRWRIPGGPGDSIHLRVSDSTGVVVDTVLAAGVERGVGVLPPGTYDYRAESSADSVGAGRFDVEARTDEMLPTPAKPDSPPRRRSAALLGDGSGSPLRTSPWVYLLVLALLSAEWIGRRRAGLR